MSRAIPTRTTTDLALDALASLQRVSTAVQSAGDPDTLYLRLLQQALEALQASAGVLFVTAEQGGLHLGASSDVGPAGVVEMENLARQTVANPQPMALARTGLRGRARPGDAGDRGDTLSIPLLVHDRRIGQLVLSRDSELGSFGSPDLGVARVVGAELGLAIDRSHLERDLAERTREAELLHRQLREYARDVRSTFTAEKQRAEELARALAELQETYLSTVRGLAVAVEAKDAYTAGHLIRVMRYGVALLQMVAPAEEILPQVEYGFLLHDIGKLAIPDAILGKPGPLTPDEWVIMRNHPAVGSRILEGIPFLSGAREIVARHHERWDGRGYPLGLSGLEIPLAARVFPLADSFDAMTTTRPYRPAMSVDEAFEEIRLNSGTQFWPEAADAFLSMPRPELDAAMSEDAFPW